MSKCKCNSQLFLPEHLFSWIHVYDKQKGEMPKSNVQYISISSENHVAHLIHDL